MRNIFSVHHTERSVKTQSASGHRLLWGDRTNPLCSAKVAGKQIIHSYLMALDVVAMEVAATEVVVMKHVQLEFALLTGDLRLWGSSGLLPLPPKWEMDQSPSATPSGFHGSTERDRHGAWCQCCPEWELSGPALTLRYTTWC